MKRTLYLKVEIDWDKYNDVSDELILEDTGIFENIKEGVNIEQINK